MPTGSHPDEAVAQFSLDEIRRITADVLDGLAAQVYLFGSWARGEARRTSDIDIAVLLPSAANRTVIAEIKARLDESNIPYHVDVVDLRYVTDVFRERVLRDGIRLTLSRTSN